MFTLLEDMAFMLGRSARKLILRDILFSGIIFTNFKEAIKSKIKIN